MYDFYVLYLHVICICRSGAPVVKMWNHSAEPKSAALLGNSIQKMRNFAIEMTFDENKMADFDFTNAAFACMLDESKKSQKTQFPHNVPVGRQISVLYYLNLQLHCLIEDIGHDKHQYCRLFRFRVFILILRFSFPFLLRKGILPP